MDNNLRSAVALKMSKTDGKKEYIINVGGKSAEFFLMFSVENGVSHFLI